MIYGISISNFLFSKFSCSIVWSSLIKIDDLTRFGYKQKPKNRKIHGIFGFFGYVLLKSNVESWWFRVFLKSKFDN